MPSGYELRPNDPVSSKEGIRQLTTKERSMVQTFPIDYKFCGSVTNQEQMIGNAVPVNLAKYIGIAINKYSERMHNLRMNGYDKTLQIEFADGYLSFVSDKITNLKHCDNG